MNRLLLSTALLMFATPAYAQMGALRISSVGSEEITGQAQPKGEPGIRLRIMKVINGVVPAYDAKGNVIPDTRIKYVFTDMYGRQRGAIGEGLSGADHKMSVAFYDGYIDASKVTKFMMAKTGRNASGAVTAVRTGSDDADSAGGIPLSFEEAEPMPSPEVTADN